MKKRFFTLIVVVLIVSMLGACSPADDEPQAAEGDLQVVKVGVAWNEKIHSLIQAWQDYMEQYAETYGPENGIEFEFIVNVADGDATQQANNIQDLINQDVDIIVARPQDAGTIGASIEAAKEAGIPFVTLDRTSSSGDPTTHVGEDSYLQAETTARAFAALLEENNVDGKCIEVQGDLLDNNAVLRHDAWVDVEEELGAWETIVAVPTEWKPEKFYSGALNALQAHPEANCMYVASDFTFSSIENALQAVDKLAPSGEPNHIWMAAEDVNPQGYEAMLEGYIDVGTTWEAYDVSVQLVEVLTMIAKGEEVDSQYLIAGRLATPETVDDLEYLYAKEYAD